MPPGTRFALPLVGLVAAAVAAIPAIDTLSAASLVARAAGLSGAWVDGLAAVTTGDYVVTETTVPSRAGALRARIYLPARPFKRSVVLTPGVHMDGIDEARLVKLAGDIAATGLGVVTAELPELREYRITPTLPDLIEDTAIWAASDRRLAPDGRMGLVGISFSGGLSLVAAGRPALAGGTAFTLSFGGHGDLARTLRYLCTGVQPDGVVRPPHDYGVVVVLLNVAHLVVPAGQVAPLRLAIRTFLRASSLDMVDKAQATREFARATEMETGLPEPARTLMHEVNTRDVKALGPRLEPLVDQYADAPGLSPARSPPTRAQVFLLHGADDTVVPAIESTLLAEWYRSRHTPVRVLVTPLITHAEVDHAASQREIWNLVSFWREVLEQ